MRKECQCDHGHLSYSSVHDNAQTQENRTEQRYLLSPYLNANGGSATEIPLARDMFDF